MWHIALFDRGYCLAEDLADARVISPCEITRGCVHTAGELRSAIVQRTT
jgi:hypothetical protein